MRSMRLSDLRKRSNKYFTKLGTISPRTGKRTAEYIARRSYESLPKRIKENVSDFDRERWIKTAAHSLQYSGDQGMDLYAAIKEAAETTYKKVYSSQKKEVWNQFRVLESAVYNHFNTYMYRLGYSASKYWFENVVFTNRNGSVITATLELPEKMSGIKYTALEILYDYSGVSLSAYMY